jgi:hypothetical protein
MYNPDAEFVNAITSVGASTACLSHLNGQLWTSRSRCCRWSPAVISVSALSTVDLEEVIGFLEIQWMNWKKSWKLTCLWKLPRTSDLTEWRLNCPKSWLDRFPSKTLLSENECDRNVEQIFTWIFWTSSYSPITENEQKIKPHPNNLITSSEFPFYN